MKSLIGAGALSLLFIAGSVAAQSGVSITSNPVTAVISPNTSQASLGTFTITGPLGTSVNSVPLTITAGGGATVGNLSNCRLYDAVGNSVTTGANVVGSIGAGANTFAFNSPVALTGNSVTYTVRCDVSSAAPVGTSTFTMNAGTPNVSASQQLAVSLDTAPSVPRGSQDVTLANITLSADTAMNVRVSSLPISLSTGGGATPALLTDCRIRDASDLTTVLTGSINPSGGTTVFALATPSVVLSGTEQTLNLTCDVSAASPIGGTFSFVITPSTVGAVNVATGAAITPGSGGFTSGTIIVSGEAIGGTPGLPGTPGIPNTGAGGAAAGILLALIAAMASVFAGATYLRRTA